MLDLSVKTAHRIRLPASTSARQEMYADLRKAKKPVAFEIDVPIAKEQPPALSHIFIIPEDLCRQEFVGPSKGRENCSIFPLNVNFVGICVTPILDGIVGIGGMRAMESKLEMIFSPVRDIAGHGSPIQHGRCGTLKYTNVDLISVLQSFASHSRDSRE